MTLLSGCTTHHFRMTWDLALARFPVSLLLSGSKSKRVSRHDGLSPESIRQPVCQAFSSTPYESFILACTRRPYAMRVGTVWQAELRQDGTVYISVDFHPFTCTLIFTFPLLSLPNTCPWLSQPPLSRFPTRNLGNFYGLRELFCEDLTLYLTTIRAPST